jgi:regulatory protein
VVNRQGTPVSLQARALRWLSQREYSRKELRARLLRAADAAAKATRAGLAAQEIGEDAHDASPPEAVDESSGEGAIDEAVIDVLLDHLQTRGLLSDERFAESRIRLRARRFGNQRIAGELKQHGLSLEPDAARELAASEPMRAAQAWQRRFGKAAVNGAASAPAERARQERFLIGRGFPADVARRVVAAGARGELLAEQSPEASEDV